MDFSSYIKAVVIGALGLSACGGTDSHAKSPTATPSVTRTAAAAPTASASVTPTPIPTASPPATPTASPVATPVRTPLSCGDLAGASIGGSTIRSAAVVPATGGQPELCKVTARIDPALNFEVRLPSEWNHKAVFIGGGGYNGAIPSPGGSLVTADLLGKGYATIATDSGHTGSPLDASWALNDPVAVENFAYRAGHAVLAAAREIVVTRYASPIRRTYYEGSSSGGREALIMAQRWPDDCDGVIAREPVLNFVAVQLAANRIAKHMFATPGGFLPPAAVLTLGRAVLQACDGLDGLEDGIVSDVEGCDFDPAVLRCPGLPDDGCLTDQQLDTVHTVHSALQLAFPLAHGVMRHPRWPVGGELSATGWPLWLTGPSPDPPASLLFILSDGFLKHFATKDPQLDSLEFSSEAYVETLQSLSELFDATDPDLSRFAAHGGKVILWHGWSDYALSAYSTVEYYEQVVSASGGQAAADELVRFYTAPGVDHLLQGAGAPIVDLVSALDGWIEDGVPPGDLVAYKSDSLGGAPVPFRPLCRYPTYPRYAGSGDPNLASSFHCASP